MKIKSYADVPCVVRHPLDRVHAKSSCGGVSKTSQAHKDQCCINRMMRTYERTGVLPLNPRGKQPQYGDVSGLNKPYDQLILDTTDTLQNVAKQSALKKVEARKAKAAADKAARDAEIEAAVNARLAAAKSTSS